jgi:hypothetical protein
MRIKKLPLNEALKFVKEARNRVNPNPGTSFLCRAFVYLDKRFPETIGNI